MGEFEQIPEIKERIERSKMELQEFGFYWAPEWDSQSCADQDFVNNFKKGWLYQQSKIEQLEKINSKNSNTLQHLEYEYLKLEKRIEMVTKSIDSFFDEQTMTPSSREYSNFIAHVEKALRGECG